MCFSVHMCQHVFTVCVYLSSSTERMVGDGRWHLCPLLAMEPTHPAQRYTDLFDIIWLLSFADRERHATQVSSGNRCELVS